MNKNLTFVKTAAILILGICLIQKSRAQAPVDVKKINELVEKNASGIRMSPGDRLNSRISSAYYSKQSGVLLVYLQQTYKGIDVYNSLQVLAFKDDKLVSSNGSFTSKIEARVNNTEGVAQQRPENAVSAAARHLNLPAVAVSAKPTVFTEGAKEAEFGTLGIAKENIKTKLLWIPVNDGQSVKLCWQVAIQPVSTPDYWLVRIDANTNEFVSKANLTIKCNWTNPAVHQHTADCYEEQEYGSGSAAPEIGYFKDPAAINSAKYRVIPFPAEAPSFPGGTPALVTNPWLLAPAGSPATTLKWNDDGTTVYPITRGNNVFAQEDHNANDGFGLSAKSKTSVPDLNFDYTPDLEGEPYDSLNLGFSLTNLFYWTNIMHDLSYQYGFDEVAGNFQAGNLGRGGKGNDAVIADGQDFIAFDNSNFATPPDGQSPRMQMFLFDYNSAKNFQINAPAANAGFKIDQESNFSKNNKLVNTGPITGDVVLYKGATATDNGACGVASNAAALKNHIALIERGDCTFTRKTMEAQLAGAKAVIIFDNVVSNQLVIMSGDSNIIKIPAVFINRNDGLALKAILASGKTLNVTIKTHLMDGSLDAGVISHEYTHGISNRLTGGPAETGCLENAEQMGEGWSDYYALMATTNWTIAKTTDGTKQRTIGTYVVNQPITGSGIRKYPYTTDMTANPWTYALLKTGTLGGEEHYVGEIWCTALWDMTWAIIQQDGVINKDIFNATNEGGNTVALKLVTEAMKLQRCGPGFIDARNAILKADTLLYNGKYNCSIWAAFAKRGMGVKASEGSSTSVTDQVADFTVPSGATMVKHVNKDSAAQKEELTYSVGISCGCAGLSNVKIIDTLPQTLTYVSGGNYNSSNRVVSFTDVNLQAKETKQFTFKAAVNDGTYFAPSNLLADNVNAGSIPAATWQNESTSGTSWRISGSNTHTGSFSYFASDSSKPVNEILVTKNAYKLSGVSQLSFWHLYNTEDDFDGGAVEISTDNGATWVDLGPYMLKNGYNSKIDKNNATILSGHGAFSGASGGIINTVINLSSFAGSTVKFRFVFATDVSGSGDGWYIDDISLSSQPAALNIARLYGLNNDSLILVADTITAITNAPLPVLFGNFTVQKGKQGADLKWTTAQEINSAKFIIERSADGSAYYEIGEVAAAGSSNRVLSYTHNDATPMQGLNYYRIKELDRDGRPTYSLVRSLDFDGEAGRVSITPNPAKGKVLVTVTGNNKPLNVYIVNSAGQRMQTYVMTGQYLQIILPPVAAGVYHVNIEGKGTKSQHKLVIE